MQSIGESLLALGNFRYKFSESLIFQMIQMIGYLCEKRV